MLCIGDDHEELSDPAAGSWSVLSAAHRDLSAIDPPLGEFDSQGNVYRFPAMVELDNLGPISDALVGRKRWTSPAVQIAKSGLLKPITEELRKELEAWKVKATKEVLQKFQLVKAMEGITYGKNRKQR